MEEYLQAAFPENGRIVKRSYFESLSTFDLIKMAEKSGVDIPYDLDRIFIIDELYEIYSQDVETPEDPSETETEMLDVDTVLVESAALPKQYNITFIEVMIRDPFWAFVFWEIKTQDREQAEKAPDFEGYFLRISPVNDSAKNTAGPVRQSAEAAFTIPVETEDNARYLGLNPAISNGSSGANTAGFPAGSTRAVHSDFPPETPRRFTVELCARFKGEETVLAVSNTVKLPRLPGLPTDREKKEECGAWNNPLIRLSGYEDFRILRNNERTPRIKKGAANGSHE